MLKTEFEKIAGYKVSDESYYNVIEPMYYSVKLNKFDFVKSLNRKAFELKETRKPCIKRMLVRDRMGYTKTPNGCYYHIQYVDMVDVDISTGKIIVAPLDDEILFELSRTNSLDAAYDFDFDYTNCVDTQKNAITLKF